MQKAAFSITKYQFDKVFIDLEEHKSDEMNLDFVTSGIYYKENSSYELVFTLKVTNIPQAKPFVEVRCIGIFQFENVNSFEEIPDFFYKNSIAILFPFVRAYVSIITIQANVPSVMLPTLNLSSLESELRENTTLK